MTSRTAWQETEEGQKMLRGELYHAFAPEFMAARRYCEQACNRFNNSGDVSRRSCLELFNDIIGDTTPLPPPPSDTTDPSADDAILASHPYIRPPFYCDYGTNITIEPGVFINLNAVFIDTCRIHIGARTLIAPNVSFYSGTHPVEPWVRNGMEGPELGGEIWVEEDCWLGGNVVICPGVRIGKGSTVGAGSVVTKDVAPYTVVAGNPARLIRHISKPDQVSSNLEGSQSGDQATGVEEAMIQQAEKLEAKGL